MQVLGQWVNGAANNDQMRTKEFYEKPSVKKARQAKEVIKRKRKADRIRAAKMGL